MSKKYKSSYEGYVYSKPKTYWSSDEDVKSKLKKVDFTKDTFLKEGGIPVISDGKTAYIDVSDAHTVFGATSGMKKSICGVMPLIYVLGKTNERMIITDPKGELYAKTSGYLKANGKKVYCLNFRTCDKDGYNILRYPAQVYRSGEKDRGIALLSDLINILAEKQRSSGKCDPFWPETACMFKNGTAKIIMDSFPEIDFINILNWAEFNIEKNITLLSELISGINSEDAALLNLRAVLSEPEKTLLSTLSTASSFLSPFIQNNKLARMLSNSTFSLEELCDENSALFIITDDTTTTCDSIVGIIISQIQSYLIDQAYKSKSGKLSERVNFILDEFTSYPIPNMEVALATHRSRNIRYHLCLQTIDGIAQRYEHYESLLSNCGNTFFLGSTEKAFLDRISEQCGRTQITPDGKEQPLISPAELTTLKKTWESKEAIYLNLYESIRYCTTLPSIEAYDIGNYPVYEYTIKHPRIKKYSLFDLMTDISYGKATTPFSLDVEEAKPKTETRQKSKRRNRAAFEQTAELSESVRKELETKFDELYGSTDSNNDN